MIFLILLLVKLTACYEETFCCSNENVIDEDSLECLNNAELLLNCENKHHFDPELYDIDLFDNGDLRLLDNFVVSVPNYCLANFTVDNGATANFGYLVCLNNDVNVMLFVQGSLMAMTVIFLLLTLLTYSIVPDLRQTMDKVTAFSVFSFMFFMTFLSMIQFRYFDLTKIVCKAIGYLTYFFAISYFAWLQIISVNVLKLTVGRRWKINERIWYATNHLYAWLMAIFLSRIVLFCKKIGDTCWFDVNEDMQWFFHLPLTITITFNLFIYAIVTYYLFIRNSVANPTRKKVLKYNYFLYLKVVFFPSILLWVFEVLSFNFLGHYTQIVRNIADCINCLHGVFLFIILIVGRQRIKRGLAGIRVVCYRFPIRWSEIEDNEQETLTE